MANLSKVQFSSVLSHRLSYLSVMSISVCLSSCQPYLCVCVSVCQSFCLSVCLSVFVYMVCCHHFVLIKYDCFKVKPLNVEHLMMDASLLLPATATPLTGIEFSKRLACGEVEHTNRVKLCTFAV